MLIYLARRLVASLFILLGVSVVTFGLTFIIPADPVVVHIAEGIGLAAGSLPAAAWQLDHRQPNVAAIEQGDRDLLLVTSGAMQMLTRDELEAVCAELAGSAT